MTAPFGRFDVAEAIHVDCQGVSGRVELDLAEGDYAPGDADEAAALAHLERLGHATRTAEADGPPRPSESAADQA